MANSNTGLDNPLFKRCSEVAVTLRSLAHPDRLKILCTLADKAHPVGDLVELCSTSQSGVSQFLAKMRSDGLVTTRKKGVQVFYQIANPELKKVIRALKKIYGN